MRGGAQRRREGGGGGEWATGAARHQGEAGSDDARKREGELIVMAAHGRRGVSALLLGSETQKVLAHSKVPVLIVR